MIDLNAQLKAYDLLKNMMINGITNYHLEDNWPHSKDRAVCAIIGALWEYYNDYPEQVLDIIYFDKKTKDMIIRCMHFFTI